MQYDYAPNSWCVWALPRSVTYSFKLQWARVNLLQLSFSDNDCLPMINLVDLLKLAAVPIHPPCNKGQVSNYLPNSCSNSVLNSATSGNEHTDHSLEPHSALFFHIILSRTMTHEFGHSRFKIQELNSWTVIHGDSVSRPTQTKLDLITLDSQCVQAFFPSRITTEMAHSSST